jgi:5-amino-6-(5-phosphoribosylamino)uracil reductase
VSIDGYLGSATGRRLELSNDADFDRLDAVRASYDAILMGAATVRNDNPRLLVRSKARRDERTVGGLPPSPTKVTVTERMESDPCAHFFTTGQTEKPVYCASPRVLHARTRLGSAATVVDGCRSVQMRRISEDLGAHGMPWLMVEGGGNVHNQFLTDNLLDERHPRAPRSLGARPGSPAGAQRSTAAQPRSTARTDCSTPSPCRPDRTTSRSASCRQA